MSKINQNDIPTDTADIPAVSITKIPIEKLVDFRNHAFKKYTGDRLTRLAKSIEDSGIIQPIIVRPKGKDKYEILSGHNRIEAAKLLRLTEVPAVIRADLKDDDEKAKLLANETNIEQRSFNSWLPSEKAKSIHQYYSTVKQQGKRKDLNASTSSELQEKSESDAQEKTALVYGVTPYTIELNLRLYELIDQLKDRLDAKEFGVTPARSISHISKEKQKQINSVLEEDETKEKYEITMTNSKELRDLDKQEKLTDEKIRELLSKKVKLPGDNVEEPEDEAKSPDEYETIKMKAEKYSQYFSGKSNDEISYEIVDAMDIKKKISDLITSFFSDGELSEKNTEKFIHSFTEHFQISSPQPQTEIDGNKDDKPPEDENQYPAADKDETNPE
jgi:ParB family chromosome partitioning protein